MNAPTTDIARFEPFSVSWEGYQGPLDALLDRVRDESVVVSEVPLKTLTDQFLSHLVSLPTYPLYFSAEALWFLGALLELKSIALLPKLETVAEEEEMLAIEESLIDHIAAYRTFKAVASSLAERKDFFQQAYPRPEPMSLAGPRPVRYREADVSRLVAAFREVLNDYEQRTSALDLAPRGMTVAERIRELARFFRSTPDATPFSHLFATQSRDDMVVTFLALLELLRRQVVALLLPEQQGGEMVFVPKGEAVWN